VRMARTDRPGRGFRGRSKQRPYGMLVRQDASGSRRREQAPALQRNVATLNLEIGGRESQKSRAGCGQIAERGRKSKETALREGLWVNPYGIHGTGPALRDANPVHTAGRFAATFGIRRLGGGGTRWVGRRRGRVGRPIGRRRAEHLAAGGGGRRVVWIPQGFLFRRSGRRE
jgi:hypothetical protein